MRTRKFIAIVSGTVAGAGTLLTGFVISGGQAFASAGHVIPFTFYHS